MKIRRLIGIAHLVNTVIMLTAALATKYASDSNYYSFWPVYAASAIWLFSTIKAKVAMAAETQFPFLNFIAVISFPVMMYCFERWGVSFGSSFPFNTLTLITGTLFVFGGFITDLLDLIIHWPFKRMAA